MKATLAGKHHYLMYFLATAMKPRMLLTLDEDGKLLPVPCRVGAAVDTVAQVRNSGQPTVWMTRLAWIASEAHRWIVA